MDVFSLSIKYLKDHCLKPLNSRGVLSNQENVKFVLTVPAIWSDRSKQFMRVAAIEVYIIVYMNIYTCYIFYKNSALRLGVEKDT